MAILRIRIGNGAINTSYRKGKRGRRLRRSGESESDTHVPYHVSHHVISRLSHTFDLHDKTASMMACLISVVEHFVQFSLAPASQDSYAMPSTESSIDMRIPEPESTTVVEE